MRPAADAFDETKRTPGADERRSPLVSTNPFTCRPTKDRAAHAADTEVPVMVLEFDFSAEDGCAADLLPSIDPADPVRTHDRSFGRRAAGRKAPRRAVRIRASARSSPRHGVRRRSCAADALLCLDRVDPDFEVFDRASGVDAMRVLGIRPDFVGVD